MPGSEFAKGNSRTEQGVAFHELDGGDLDPELIMTVQSYGRDLSSVLKTGKHLEQALYHLAFQALNLGNKKLARRRFQVLCLLNPRIADYWLGLALSHRSWPNQHSVIAESLKKARELDADNPGVRLRLIEYQLSCGNLEAARQEVAGSMPLIKASGDRDMISYAQRLVGAFELIPPGEAMSR